MPSDLLTEEQLRRLAALHAVRDALCIEVDGFELIRCAHWVVTGTEMPISSEAVELASVSSISDTTP